MVKTVPATARERCHPSSHVPRCSYVHDDGQPRFLQTGEERVHLRKHIHNGQHNIVPTHMIVPLSSLLYLTKCHVLCQNVVLPRFAISNGDQALPFLALIVAPYGTRV